MHEPLFVAAFGDGEGSGAEGGGGFFFGDEDKEATGHLDNGELANGLIAIGPWEIALLDNDPNFQENGVLKITALGGKA